MDKFKIIKKTAIVTFALCFAFSAYAVYFVDKYKVRLVIEERKEEKKEKEYYTQVEMNQLDQLIAENQ